MALLGLRVMSGAAAILVGVAYMDGWSLSWPERFVGLFVAIDGLLLMLGLLTPVAGVLAPILAAAVAFEWALPPSPWSVQIRAVALPFSAIALSLVALGPGAYSLDARLYGVKQLRIPPRPPA